MEVNHERLPSLAAYGLMALRSGVDPTSGPLFLDCLQPASRPPVAPPAETAPSGPRAADVEPPETVLEDLESVSKPEESRDEEPDSDESTVAPQVAAVEQAPPTPTADNEVTMELVGHDEEASPTEGPVEAQHTLAVVLEPNTAPVTKVEEQAVAGPIATDLELTPTTPGNLEHQIEATTPVSEKPKRGTTRLQDAVGHSEEPAAGTVDKPVAKPAIPVTQTPDNSTILAPPEVAPLELARSEDADPASPAQGANAVVVEVGSLPASAESGASVPSVDSSASATQATPNPAAGVVATALKPPALLLKANAGSAEATSPAGEIDPAKFLSRVAKAFESAHQRGGEVRLRLHPAELGALSIEVRIHDNVLTASVQAETPEAKAAIIDNLPALRERLADQGIRIDKFDVDLMDHSDRRQQSLDEQTRQQEARQSATPRHSSRRAVSAEPAPTSSHRNRASGQGGLNVVI